MGTKGLVFNVQGYSVHDGPGIRTIVFLKGCPLGCQWCSNPESQNPNEEVGFNPARCLGLAKCQMCLKGCPYGAIVADDKGADYPTIKRSLCQKCPDYACRKACPAGALVVYGDFLEPLEVIKRVEKDEVFFQRGGGGLTVSGGEPLNQPDFLLDLLSLAHKRRLKTALETSGFGSYEVLKAAARVVENILYDVKVISRAKHLAGTGQDNELILDNLKRLTADFPKLSILVRTPVVPGFNDTSKDAQELGQFLRALPNVTFEALPYHRFGEGKYGFLGRTYPLAGLTLDPKALEDFNRLTLAARNL